MPRYVDLSHTIEHGLVTYAGIPSPVVGDWLRREDSESHYAEGTRFHIGRIEMVANTGTYIDSPFHRYAEGADIAALALESVADLPGLVVDAPPGERAVGAGDLPAGDFAGRAVLVRTGWSRHWRTERYFSGYPYLTRAAAEHLVAEKVALVGIDSLNIDDDEDGTRPVHTLLLGAGIPIVEHLCGLEALPARGFRFHAVPVPVRGLGSFPVRAFAIVDA